MKALALALIAASAATAAAAQDNATFDNPSPVNFDRPFLYDAVQVRMGKDSAAPVPVIIVPDGRRLPPQTTPIEQWLRDNPQATGTGKSDRNLRAPMAPDAKGSPQD